MCTSFFVLDLFRLSAENMCILNGKKSFDIPNVPPDHVLIRFNVLFAYVFEAVSGAKGMMQLKIDPSKHQTINALMRETFPAIKCYDNEKLHGINHKLIAYMHALIIDSISIVFTDSIKSRALEHEGAMVDVYSKMKPDVLRSQLQTVLTPYYEDIKGVVSASGCTKSKIIERKFEDQEDTERAADSDADAADAAATTPATPPDGGAAAASGGEEPLPAPSPGLGPSPGNRGGWGGGGAGKNAKPTG
jgi:hypothetical protein